MALFILCYDVWLCDDGGSPGVVVMVVAFMYV